MTQKLYKNKKNLMSKNMLEFVVTYVNQVSDKSGGKQRNPPGS